MRCALILVTLLVLSNTRVDAAEWSETLVRADSLAEASLLDSALVVGELALQKAVEQFGQVDTTAARVLHRMGNYCYQLGRYDSCQALWQRSIDIRRQVQGPISTDIASLLQNMATLKGALGKSYEAIEGLEEVLRIRESLGEMHTRNTANTLNNLSRFYSDVGRIDEAVAMNTRARELYAELLGPEHPMVGVSLGNAAVDLIHTGRDARGEQYCLRAMEIMRPVLGDDHPQLTNVYLSMAVILKNRGRNREAEDYLYKVINIIKTKMSDTHRELLSPMYNLGDLYADEGDYGRADSVLAAAQNIAAVAAGQESDDYFVATHNRALKLSEAGNYILADSLWHSIGQFWGSGSKADERRMSVLLDAMATSHRERGDTTVAESLMTTAVERTRAAYGDRHPKTAQAERHLARIWFDQGRYSDAAGLARHAFETSLELIRDNAPYVTERDALRISNNLRYDRNLLLSAVLAGDRFGAAPMEIADVVLSSKGQISDAIFQRKRKVAASQNPQINMLKGRLQAARHALSNAFFEGDEAAGTDDDLITKLNTEVDSLERELVLAVGADDNPAHEEGVSTSTLAEHLPENGLLIEYLRFGRFSPGINDPKPAYVAVTMSPQNEVHAFSLGDASDVDSLVSAYRGHMKSIAGKTGLANEHDNREYHELAGHLAKRIWAPLDGVAHDARAIYLSPDGALNLVSFGSLPVEDDAYLLESHQLYYLGAGRDLLNEQKQSEQENDNLLALGAPAFDLLSDTVEPQPALLTSSSPMVVDVQRGSGQSDCLNHGLDSVRALPLSRYEVETIAKEWTKEHPKATVTLLMDADASEERFKSEAPSCGVIHLATHGFYFSALCPDGGRGTTSPPHPLLSSGLFLAGANVRDDLNTERAEDGILTAFELAEMNLSKAHLAVLSACETGLGKVSDGEGVYGLRRAFQMAGVQSVVCSLWPVSDRLTAKFMTNLYAMDAISPAEAIQELQLAELHRLRDAGLSDHPAHWAAFIVCSRGRQ